MSAIVPLYDILELQPGAGQAEIDAAYRRLIKQYHPDHAGGDGARAAEINRAYALLKDPVRRAQLAGGGSADATMFGARPMAGAPAAGYWPAGYPRRRSRLQWLAPAAIAGALLLIVNDQRAGWWIEDHWARLKSDLALALDPTPGLAASSSVGAVPGPIDLAAVGEGHRRAAVLIALDGPLAATEASRQCYRDYRRLLRSAMLDKCLAFDQAAAATLVVSGREPVRYFQPLAITARQIAAAKLLSRDYGWIEERLDRVRAYVEPIIYRSPAELAGPVGQRRD